MSSVCPSNTGCTWIFGRALRQPVLSAKFEVGVSLLLAPTADKRGPKAPFPLVENAGIQPAIRKRVPGGSRVLLKALGSQRCSWPRLKHLLHYFRTLPTICMRPELDGRMLDITHSLKGKEIFDNSKQHFSSCTDCLSM